MNNSQNLVVTKENLSKITIKSWKKYLNNQENFGHAERILSDFNLVSHINNCLASSKESILRIKSDTKKYKPKYILEIGSSVGFLSLQAKNLYPDAIVIGIEPEKEAVKVSQNMVLDLKLNHILFTNGFGEKLPFKDEQFDLIICHTVIEHVKDVELVLFEMRRVLTKEGIIHLEAPNYNWPYEPHLTVWCVPRFGKRFVKFLSILQKKKPNVEFLDHLQFVHPSRIEKRLNELSMRWENLFLKKLLKIINGNNSSVKQYVKLSKILAILKNFKLDKFTIKLITIFKIYPSLMYLIYKK